MLPAYVPGAGMEVSVFSPKRSARVYIGDWVRSVGQPLRERGFEKSPNPLENVAEITLEYWRTADGGGAAACAHANQARKLAEFWRCAEFLPAAVAAAPRLQVAGWRLAVFDLIDD